MQPARPIFLGTEPDATFALFHAAGAAPDATGVLICPPWGWDEVASYRSRRAWAVRLAAHGHPTLRLDYPATGNSGGSPRDPDRVDAWVGAIAAASEWLRDSGSNVSRVAVLGLGLGGLLAREALRRGTRFEELVLWGAPVSGRSFVREVRAFSRLQAWNGAGGDDAEGDVDDGVLEAGGFLLTEETIAELGALDPEVPGGSLERALMLERDGVAPDEGLRGRIESAGAEVAVGPGGGWADMVSHAERTRLPDETAGRIESWLTDGANGGRGLAVAREPVPRVEQNLVDVGGREVRETPFLVQLPFGDAFGMLAEPIDEQASQLCAICLNAGAVRNIGPNRIWVETGRRWAAKGVRTLRIDLEGIGESDGEAPSDVAEFYLPKFEDQLRVVLDLLEERGLGTEFLLVGLCGGGYWAFRETLQDPRVSTALLLNSGALEWDPALIAEREARKLNKATELGSWRKLLRGEVSGERIARLGRSLAVQAGRRLKGGRDDDAGHLEADLDRLREAGTSLTMAFSDREPLLEELNENGILGRLANWPNIELAKLPGDDHTLRSIQAQAGAREMLDRGLARALGPEELSVAAARKEPGC